MITSRLGGIALLAAAPVTLAAELVRSDHSQEKYAAQLADVAGARTPELVAGALFLLAAALLIPAAIGIAGLAHGRGGRLIGAGALLLGIASIWLAAGRAVFCFMLYALTGAGVPHGTATAALERIGGSGAFALLLVSLVALLLAPIVLTLGFWRAGRGSWWVAPIWVVATVGFLAVETSKLGDLIGFGAMMAVLASIGVAAVRADSSHAERVPGIEPHANYASLRT
jgi:hypothetical protein